MNIKNINIPKGALLAPIAGYSDVGFRAICAEMGASITYTEMASAKGMYYEHADKTEQLLFTTSSEKIKAAQIFGGEPFFIAKAVENKCLEKFDIIDINMGCPVPKIVKNKEGSALMLDIPRAQEVVRAAKSATDKPITIKMRLGFDNIIAVDFAKAMEDAGADAITVHGRTRKEMYSGHAHWDEIAKVVQAVSIPVIANGDVLSKEDYDQILLQTGAAEVMIARGALGNPNIFADIVNKPHVDKKELIIRHLDTLLEFHNEKYVLVNFRKHLVCYAKGVIGSKELKKKAFEALSINELKTIIQESNL